MINTAIWLLRLDALLDIFFPRSCVQCSGSVEASPYQYICRTCSFKLTLAYPPSCNTCGYPYITDCVIGKDCPHCAELSPSFDRGNTLLIAKEVGRSVIHSLKYRQGLFLIKDLKIILKKLPHLKALIQGATLVPVPLHPTKLRERGFNQSKSFAKVVHGVFKDATTIEELLIRKTYTGTQTKLNRKKRIQNIQGAFELAPQIKLDLNKKYILLDDVFTTGATLNECAKVLKSAGARSVEILSIGHG